MEVLTANLSGKVRRATLCGREHLVAPLTLIVPGVLNGSKGPLLYLADELGKDPAVWNHIPIVVYHPESNGQNTSARLPDVLNAQGIGVLLNTAVKDQRLVAEGWFDLERLRAVDSRVLAALETGKPLEVSTGLYTTNEPAEAGATFQGKPYLFIARNYRPDHLAVLPDQVGACSIRDGCGVLVNAETRLFGFTSGDQDHQHTVSVGQSGHGWTNVAAGHSHLVADFRVQTADGHTHDLDKTKLVDSGVRNAVTKTVDGKKLPASAFAYVPDPESPSTWKLRIDDLAHVGAAVAALGKGFRGQKVSIPAKDLPAVKRKLRVAWLKAHPDKSEQDLPSILTNQRRSVMTDNDRKDLVDNLIANKCCWHESDRELLSRLDDDVLNRLNEQAEEVAKKIEPPIELEVQGIPYALNEESGKWEPKNPEDAKQLVANKGVTEPAKPQSTDEWLEAAPAEVQSAVRNAMDIEAREKRQLVARLVSNIDESEGKKRLQEQLQTKPLDELRTLAVLAPKPKAPAPAANYLGAAAPPTNQDEDQKFRKDVLPLPTINWAEERVKTS